MKIEDILPNDKIQVQFYTEVKLTGGKSNPFNGRVKKLSTVYATATGEDVYADRVGHQLFVEGKSLDGYAPKKRAWGVREGNTPIILHNGKRYLEFIVETTVTTVYLLDGVKIEPKDIQGFPEPRQRNENSQGGIEEEVKVRCVSEENIFSIVPLVVRKKKNDVVKVTFSLPVEYFDDGAPDYEQKSKAAIRALKEMNIDPKMIDDMY